MNEGKREVAYTLNGNHQHDAFSGLLSKRKGLAVLLARDPINHGKVPIRALLDNSATELGFLVRIQHADHALYSCS